MYYEVIIKPHHAGFGMYDTTRCNEGFESETDLLAEILNEPCVTVYELGVDELPEGIDDIRGKIHNEPETVFALNTPNGIEYLGITEAE